VDAHLELELAVCASYRVRHSEFLAWSDSDRDKALWQHIRAVTTCKQCGTRPEEWDPERGGHRRAYRGVITDCEGCIVIEQTTEAPQMKQGRGKKVGLVRSDVEVL
jgi:hypothetical protein